MSIILKKYKINTIKKLKGNPMSPETSLAKPWPFIQGGEFPISNPTEQVITPPRPNINL